MHLSVKDNNVKKKKKEENQNQNLILNELQVTFHLGKGFFFFQTC